MRNGYRIEIIRIDVFLRYSCFYNFVISLEFRDYKMLGGLDKVRVEINKVCSFWIIE